MPPREKRAHREKTAIRRLFEEKRHIGGRLPSITEAPGEESQSEHQQEELPGLPAVPSPAPEITNFGDLTPEDFQTRKKGKRSEKATGLQVVLNAVRRNGFPHRLKRLASAGWLSHADDGDVRRRVRTLRRAVPPDPGCLRRMWRAAGTQAMKRRWSA